MYNICHVDNYFVYYKNKTCFLSMYITIFILFFRTSYCFVTTVTGDTICTVWTPLSQNPLKVNQSNCLLQILTILTTTNSLFTTEYTCVICSFYAYPQWLPCLLLNIHVATCSLYAYPQWLPCLLNIHVQPVVFMHIPIDYLVYYWIYMCNL